VAFDLNRHQISVMYSLTERILVKAKIFKQLARVVKSCLGILFKLKTFDWLTKLN